MPFELSPLPWAQDALEPHISQKTISFHHEKLQQSYVDKVNVLTQNSPLSKLSLEELIRTAWKDKGPLFNSAAQVWNHDFFWRSMSPKGGGEPRGEVAGRIREAYGSLERFREEWRGAATSLFGSGYVWLALDGGRLRITKTHNAETPLVLGQRALLCCDVWEHAYYLDYQHRRADFAGVFIDRLVSWNFVNENLEG